jgi:hypothetical protein
MHKRASFRDTYVYLALRSIKGEIEDLSNNPSGVSGSGEGGVANANLVQFYVTFLELLEERFAGETSLSDTIRG